MKNLKKTSYNGKTKKRVINTRRVFNAITCISLFSAVAILYFMPRVVPIPEVEIEPVNVEKDAKILELEKLHEENNDVYGQLTIPGTKIDYLVMYTPGKDTYLRKDFYKNYLKAGMLFVDKHNSVSPRDTNLIIYGHNMKDGTMFHDLLNYKSEEYYKTHNKFTFYTLEEKQEYEIMAVFLSKVYRVKDNVFKYYKFYNASNEEEYNDYIDNVKKMSLYDTGVTATFNDDLFTFSTCEYSQENGRLVVVAKRIS